MAKSIIKEIIIVLLLILAILLILGVILYEYVPSNKQLPETISYKTPQNVKEKLVSIEGVDEDQVILTYELNQTDLYNYQRINEYKPGKSNPFSTYETQKTENTSTTGTGTTTDPSTGTNPTTDPGTSAEPIPGTNPAPGNTTDPSITGTGTSEADVPIQSPKTGPEDFIIPVSNAQSYKEFGNSVCIPVIEAVAEAMIDYLEEYELLNSDENMSK